MRGRIFLLAAYMWRAQAAPPEIVGEFNSDDEGGSPIPPEMVEEVVQDFIHDTGLSQVQFVGPVATLFLKASKARAWDGSGQRRWYRLGYGPTHVDFILQGPRINVGTQILE